MRSTTKHDTDKQRLMTMTECMEYVGAGRVTMERIASSAGAKIKIGKRALYDKKKIDAYLDGLSKDD